MKRKRKLWVKILIALSIIIGVIAISADQLEEQTERRFTIHEPESGFDAITGATMK